MSITVYGFPTFNVTKVLYTAELLALDYQFVGVDPARGELQSAEYLGRHPLGKVPALEHDGECLVESAAICRYLARIADSPLYAGDPLALAKIDAWIDMFAMHPGRWMTVFFFQEVVRARFFQRSTDSEAIAEAQGFLDRQLPVVERQLERTPYLAGDQISLADATAAPYLQISEVTSLDLSGYPAICRWYGELRHSAAFIAAVSHFPDGQLFH